MEFLGHEQAREVKLHERQEDVIIVSFICVFFTKNSKHTGMRKYYFDDSNCYRDDDKFHP